MRLSRNTAFSKIPCGPVIVIDTEKMVSSPTNNSRYKTELCKYYLESGLCKFNGDCTFAHGADELRNSNHKVVLCRLFHMTQNCPYGKFRTRYSSHGRNMLMFLLGEQCAFIHDEYRRSSMTVQPGYAYAPHSIPANGVQALSNNCEHQYRSRRSSSGYASVDDQ
jgi:hypothetical protein